MDAQLGINKEDLEILKQLKSNPHFQANSVKIIDDCWTMLSTNSKLEQMQMLSINPDDQSSPLAEQLPQIFSAVLTLLASVLRSKYLPGQILSIFKRDLGIKNKESLQAIAQRMMLFYDRLAVLSQPYDIETQEKGALQRVKTTLRKQPLNEEIHSELQGVNFAKIVDIQWTAIHCVSYRDLNRVGEPQFRIKLTLLGTSLESQGVHSVAPQTEALNKADLRYLEMQCSRQALVYLLKELGNAIRVCEKLTK